MPQSLAGIRLERQQGISEQIVADAIRSIEIERGGSGGNKYQAALFIQSHPGPIVGGAAIFPCIFRPSVVTEFAGMRKGMKAPANLPGAHVKRADVAGRRG